MSHVVVNPKGEVVGTYAEADWRLACAAAWACNGRVHSEGAFTDKKE